MQKSKISFLTAALMVIIIIGLILWSTRGVDKTLGETCLTFSAGIAQVPVSDVGEVDYEIYADLKVPPLRPEQALEKFELEEGFRIEVVAHEPMVNNPVAMDIDADGRLWVVDMPSYMPVHDRDALETMTHEQVPQGRVVVLEDTSDNGIMDTYRVFLEGLVLPRAIKVLHDGLLIGEPPNVWHVRDADGDGKGDTKDLVYNNYGDVSNPNVHSYPGGLLWGIDNWIHSSNEGVKSLRRIDGQWQTRPFKRLGQWGMTQDNWGRLYSANNSRPLQTHFVPYGYSERHPLFEITTGKNSNIASDIVWPAHATGVNRGYRDGVLRADGTLSKATSIASTVIYRGEQFGEKYAGNAFTPEPGGNLIKRLIIDGDPSEIEAEARFAYEGREFLTSTDERFRPVNIYNAPDGSLYIVDMYRGILEHASHLTDYLRDYTVEHGLHKANSQFGRIYRIARDDWEAETDTPRFSELRPKEIVRYLSHVNGLLRDQAQQLLVQCSPRGVASSLEELTRDESAKAYTRLHALWTLEGFDRSIYDRDRLTRLSLQALEDQHPRIRASAVRILEPVIAQGSEGVLERLENLTRDENSPFVQLQLLASLGESPGDRALQLMAAILNEYADSPYFREMALTGVYNREIQMVELLRSEYNWGEEGGEDYHSVLESLAEAGSGQPEADLGHLTQAERERYENGRQLYRTCMACHGPEGQGVDGIGSSLAGSEWVQEDPKAPVRIVLQGFDGGAAERGKNIPNEMPGHGYLTNEDVAAVLTFIRQSWGNDAPPVEPEEVVGIREETSERSDIWSPNELRELLD